LWCDGRRPHMQAASLPGLLAAPVPEALPLAPAPAPVAAPEGNQGDGMGMGWGGGSPA